MTRTNLLFLVFLHSYKNTNQLDPEKEQFCKEVEQCKTDHTEVCGIRLEGDVYHLKTFPDECELLKYGCAVEEKDAYGIINMQFCTSTSPIVSDEAAIGNNCTKPCPIEDNNTVCGIRRFGEGFKVRLFSSECEMTNYNCEKNFTFNVTDSFICDGLELSEDHKTNATKYGTTESVDVNANDNEVPEIITEKVLQEKDEPPKRRKNVIVVDADMFASGGSINDTINNFFSATHVFDMPLRDVSRSLDEDTRRMMLQVFGPLVVYKPSIDIPKNISTDIWHAPTLNSCFHTCPVECPDTYAPVCGMPGSNALEPSLMFRNHCFMDAAQCNMRWFGKSATSAASAYTESSFYFCVGNTLNGVYRFLPLIRTLQHMGRLKKKGRFRTHLRNMRFFNELLSINPRLMG